MSCTIIINSNELIVWVFVAAWNLTINLEDILGITRRINPNAYTEIHLRAARLWRECYTHLNRLQRCFSLS